MLPVPVVPSPKSQLQDLRAASPGLDPDASNAAVRSVTCCVKAAVGGTGSACPLVPAT